jgi:hypothetical protein
MSQKGSSIDIKSCVREYYTQLNDNVVLCHILLEFHNFSGTLLLSEANKFYTILFKATLKVTYIFCFQYRL